MSGEQLFEGFSDDWADFISRNKNIELITKYMKGSEGRDAMNLAQVRNIISIGTGSGEIENEMMKLCPNLKEMSLLEPDSENCKILEKRFQGENETTVKVNCLNSGFESYEGPEEGFDMVFCSHVFYYLTDIALQFDRALSMVKTGGRLVVIIDQPNQIERIMFKDDPDYDFDNGLYEQLKASFVRNGLKYSEEELSNEMEITHNVIGVYFNKPSSSEERQKFMEEFERRNVFVPGTKSVQYGTSIFVARKE